MDKTGSLFSVPILQDNGIKMASFLSYPEIVPLYNIYPTKLLGQTVASMN